MNETSSKKRLAITITSLCVAVVAVICSIVAILAATNQTVKSTFKVTYKATNVAATVSASYTIKNSSAVDLGSVTINADADETTYSDIKSDTDIALSAKNKEVVFKYTFKNNSSSNSIKVTLADNASKTNVTVQYGFIDSEAQESTLTYGSTLGEVTVAANKTVNVYIKVTITEIANDASYVSDATNFISWTLEAVTAAA